MITEHIPTIILMVFLVIMSGYFSATETAFSTINKTRLRTLADKGDKKAERVLTLAEKYDTLLSTIPEWEGTLRETGYMYMYGCSPPEIITTFLIGYTPI